MSKRQAFTMIELLFVVATIAVLAAISVPNFLEAQVRSKVARARVDMSLMKAALRAYGEQYDAYPPNRPAMTAALLKPDSPAAPSADPGGFQWPRPAAPLDLCRGSGWDLAPLTTPVAWISRAMPVDLFFRKNDGDWRHPSPPEPFCYINRLAAGGDAPSSATLRQTAWGFGLFSQGPSGMWPAMNPLLEPLIGYDPTNGTCSSGVLFSGGW